MATKKVSPSEKKARTILEKVAEPHLFHDHRDQAAKRPQTAQDKLAPYAALKLRIVKARGLTAADWSLFGAPTSDPYCEVHLNDEFKKKSDTKSGTVTPVWNWEYELKVSKPGSIIGIQLFDEDLVGESDLLGYLEFPVSDLPFGKTVAGWFVLYPPESLQGEAPARIAKTIKGEQAETCGAVYLELTYNLASGDASDEFYAWCLPQPTFKAFPETGYTPAAMKALDAQCIIDQLLDIKEYAVDDIVLPALSGFIYLITWREIPVSLFALLVTIACSLRLTFFPAGMVLIKATLFLLLRNPERRRKMATHPTCVGLDDEGFTLIAQLQDTDKMIQFLERVIDIMDGTVVNPTMFRSFAAFSSNAGVPSTKLDDLKTQLRDSAKNPDTPFVEFNTSTYSSGCLVLHGHKTGEVVSCVNAKVPPNKIKYKCKFASSVPAAAASTPRKGKDKGAKAEVKFIEEDVLAEDLELRLDFRWVSNTMVLALIPDITETLIMEAAEPLAKICPLVRKANGVITDLYQWKEFSKSMGVVVALYVVTAVLSVFGYIGIPDIVFTLLSWGQMIGTILVVTFLFCFNAEFFISAVARAQAFALSKQHAAKAAKDWAFMVGEDGKLNGQKAGKNGKAAAKAETEADGGGGGFFGCAACARKPDSGEVKAITPRRSKSDPDAKAKPKGKEDPKKK